LVKKGLQSSGENFRVFDKNHEFCMNLNFSDIFINFGRICGFRPFKSFGPFLFGHLYFGL
jgi:hypothetical protein